MGDATATPHRLGTRARLALLGALLTYGLGLLLLRPATPFEWDEVLFQRSLNVYDVAEHSPHPPGYPVYVAAGRLARFLVRDPLLALQLVGILAAISTLISLWVLARRLGAPPAAAVAAGVIVALTPAFAFHANVGLSDVAGTAAALAAALALVWAGGGLRRVPWAAAATALALGVRPQLVTVVLPLGVFLVVRLVREKRWAILGLAAAAGIATFLACWLPAIFLTGAQRFFSSLRDTAHWVATVEKGTRLPGAPLGEVLTYWLVRPFGAGIHTILFWLLVVLGSFRWWRSGRRRLVLLAGSAATCYLAASMFSMNFDTAVRYGLPAMPFLALLAAGACGGKGRGTRLAGFCLAATYCAAAIDWGAPVYLLRRQPAPVWEALTWVIAHYDPVKTTVVFDDTIAPHAEYLLARAGFDYRPAEPATVYDASVRREGRVVLIAEHATPGMPLLFERAWSSPRLGRLTRGRYVTCFLMEPPASREPVFSPDWRIDGERWRLWETGVVRLPDTARPAALRLCAGNERLGLRRAGFPTSTVAPHRCADVPFTPGAIGDIAVSAPDNIYTGLPPAELIPLPAVGMGHEHLARAYILPHVAHVAGRFGALWCTDLVIANPHERPLRLAASFLATGKDNHLATRVTALVGPGQVLDVTDVLGLGSFRSCGDLGALIVVGGVHGEDCSDGRCDFLVLSRTFNAHAVASTAGLGGWLPGLPAPAGLGGGARAVFDHVTTGPTRRVSFGIASWTNATAKVRVWLADAAETQIGSVVFELPPFGHVHQAIDYQVADGSLRVELLDAREGGLVFPYLSIVDGRSEQAAHRLPVVVGGGRAVLPGTPPLPQPVDQR